MNRVRAGVYAGARRAWGTCGAAAVASSPSSSSASSSASSSSFSFSSSSSRYTSASFSCPLVLCGFSTRSKNHTKIQNRRLSSKFVDILEYKAEGESTPTILRSYGDTAFLVNGTRKFYSVPFFSCWLFLFSLSKRSVEKLIRILYYIWV